ncbi:MAG: YsnF/AvaK domain-containing protein [Acidobacteriota bacterium]|nr:YsnF/AvaK domain-containing protein [Acidobacteriota bacterium]
MAHTVIGLFDSRNEAQAAMQELIRQGFVRENIDVSNKSADSSASSTPNRSSDGPISGTMSTTEVSGSPGFANSVGNFFSSLFGDDETTARSYTDAAGEADAILTVHVDTEERARAAAEILDRNGAIDVDGRMSQSNRQNAAGTTDTTRNTANVQSGTSIPVIEEQLQVGKREVETGGARVRSRVIEKPVEASVRLREEHVVVNRNPVNREVTDADLTNFKEGDIEITEHAEKAVVGKQARVVEEVEIGKQVTEREETVRDTVRRTDVEVDEIDTDTTRRTANNKR